MFIADLINDFKVYLEVIYHNQSVKLNTYDTEIIPSFNVAISKTVDSVLMGRVTNTEQRIAESLAVVREKRLQLKRVGEDLELLRSEVRFKEKMRTLAAP